MATDKPTTRKRPPPRPSQRNIRVRPAIAIDDQELAKVVADTDLSWWTLQRWKKGKPVHPKTIRRILRSLEKRGIQLRELPAKGARRRVVDAGKAA
jgi:hypothetical protein